MSRLRPLLLALAMVLLASGCVALPSSGSVRTEPLREQLVDDTPVDFTPGGPDPGAPPAAIVSGFLDAMRATPLNTSVARQFLTSESSTAWLPEEGTVVYDAATLILVLPYLAQPERALREAARVLKPGGRLLVADLLPHDREAYRQQMGHVWLGFSEQQFSQYAVAAGLDAVRIHPLPADPRAKGPAMFVAVARRPCTDAHDHDHAASSPAGTAAPSTLSP